MKILFITDPLADLKPAKDSSIAMMRAFQARGVQIHQALAADLFVEDAVVRVFHQAVEVLPKEQADAAEWWRCSGLSEPQPLSDFDAVVVRKDPPFDLEYLYLTHLLELAETQGARVFNSGAAIRNHPEKLSITGYSQYTAPTVISSKHSVLKNFYAQHGDVVVKPLDGMGGAGIFRLKPADSNFNSVVELLTDNGRRTIMIQKYLPEITEGDKRILIIDGEPIPYVLARIPSAGENRGNLAAGGAGVAQPIRPQDAEIARRIGADLAPKGLFLIGLDMIGTHITEINVTSPTCFVEIATQTGFDAAAHFVERLLSILQR